MFNSSKEAKIGIEKLDKRIRKNKPFINKISTHQKLYKKYNKNIEDES
jgi:N-glycosylase/DNA lyase